MPQNNWIDDVISECSHVETPRSWLWWSLICGISASAGNNYQLHALKGVLTYKPNLYVMLLGESGLGKGFGVNLAKLLVQKADVTRVVAGRSSIQAIVTELAKQRTRPDGKEPIADSRGFIVNGELSAAIIADVDSLAILTDLYDGHYNPEWDNTLKVSGKEKLKNPYITTLFGSSPAHFYDTIPKANIEGGYIGRNLIVFEQIRFQNVDLLDENEQVDDRLKEIIVPQYAKHLVQIAAQSMSIVPSETARGLFNEFRRSWRKDPKPDKTGFINRVPDHILKVGMCLALSRYDFNGMMSEADIKLSIEKVTDLIKGNKMTTAGHGIDPLAEQGRLVIELFLGEKRKWTRREILVAGHGNYDLPMLDKIMDSLLEMKWFKRERIGVGINSDWEYEVQTTALSFYGRK